MTLASDKSEAGAGAGYLEGMSAKGALIGFFVRHPTAANLFMVVMLAVGFFSATQINTQFLPSLNIPVIVVTVPWPGASAQDVESQVLEAVEPELRYLDGITEVRSIAREGSGLVTLEFTPGTNMAQALGEVEQTVAAITTLPLGSERPIVRQIAFYEPVARITVTGPLSEPEIKTHARTIRDGLLRAGIDKIEFVGLRGEEIRVKVDEAKLRELNLSLNDVSRRIREATEAVPAGRLTGQLEIQLRAVTDRQTPEMLQSVEILTRPSGEKVLLRDIAAVTLDFDEDDVLGQIHGKPAIELRIKRALSADTLETMAIVDRYLESARASLPADLVVTKYAVEGRYIVERLRILIINGLQGLVLVLLALVVFLNVRVAFWVALGIPVSLAVTLGIMWLSGQTLNMVSLFGLIMMIGIIVDDAIVVGEHSATLSERGYSPLAAAEGAAVTMFKPVMAATLTTQFAFLPIFTVDGNIGQVMQAIPLVVIAVLLASTLECFLILPAHLRHDSGQFGRNPGAWRVRFEAAFNGFRDGAFRRAVAWSYRWRYTVLAGFIGAMIICLGLLAGGRIKFHFFLAPEAELVRASVVFTPGLPLEDQAKALKIVENAMAAAEVGLTGGASDLVTATFTTYGSFDAFERVRLQNLAQIEIELTPAEKRTITTAQFVAAWRAAMPTIPEVTTLAISPIEPGPPNRAIAILIQDAPVEQLKAAAVDMSDALKRFAGVTAISDDLPYGKQEWILSLTPHGVALGFTLEGLSGQLRDGFQGAIANRFARGDEEVTIKVMRQQGLPGPAELERLQVRSPQGQWVPLSTVVTWREVDSFSLIRRDGGRRTVTLSADIDRAVTTASEVAAVLDRDILPAIAAKHGVSYRFAGQIKDTQQSMADLKLGGLLALVMIYVCLAWIFEHYWRPLTIMAIVPFGLVGAVVGHVLLGMDLTVVSLIGLLGLTGILVNDAVVLVDRIGERLTEGEAVEDAAIGASQDRLRAVILTSVTTIFGLLPLLFETSRQAQFLIPLAVTLVFGLLFATLLVLFLIPILFAIGEDIRTIWNDRRSVIAMRPARR